MYCRKFKHFFCVTFSEVFDDYYTDDMSTNFGETAEVILLRKRLDLLWNFLVNTFHIFMIIYCSNYYFRTQGLKEEYGW